MRKIAQVKLRPVEVPKRPIAELGRIVVPPEIAPYAKRKCSACFGEGLYRTSVPKPDGTSETATHACGCSRRPFIEARLNEIGYDPTEQGIPVRWRKGCAPEELEVKPEVLAVDPAK